MSFVVALETSPERPLLLHGLAFFFDLAFEEFYRDIPAEPPGGVRTCPLFALAGAGFHLLKPTRAPSQPGCSRSMVGCSFNCRARLGGGEQQPTAYAVGFGGTQPGALPAGALLVRGGAGIALALWGPA